MKLKSIKGYFNRKRVILILLPTILTALIILGFFVYLYAPDKIGEIEVIREIEIESRNPNREAVIINDMRDFRDFYEDEIDFEDYSVMTLYLGEKLNGGFSIDIDKIIILENSLRVYATENYPDRNCIVTTALTYPTKTVIIPKTDKENVEVIYKRRPYSC